MNDKQRAIDIVAHSQHTHILWRAFLQAHPKFRTEDVGDINHHLECIREYDHVLSMLRQLPDRSE